MSRLLRLAGFRAALAYTALLLSAMGLVMGALYGRLADDLRQTQDNLIWRDAAVYSYTYQKNGLRGLAQTIDVPQSGQGRFLRLSDGLGNFMAGNIADFPTRSRSDADGWLLFTLDSMPIRARLVQFDDNVMLLLGQDMSATENLLVAFRRAFGLAWLAMLLIGLGGGAYLARRGLQQVEALGAGLEPVMQGDLSTRLPLPQAGAEWSVLTERINDMLAQLERLMQATRQVSDNLAHDLRAPLTRLRARLEALLAADESAAMADALEDVDGLLASFNALLTLSRLENGTGQLQAQPVDVKELLGGLHELYAPVFEDGGMVLEAALDPVSLSADAALLGQAVVNGLENALTHAAVAGSTVTLSAKAKDGVAVLAISDQGAGIAAARRDEAVQRFVQLDESRAQGGSGLGLSLMAAIAAHHGGDLVLADNQPGLKVEMRLPIEAA